MHFQYCFDCHSQVRFSAIPVFCCSQSPLIYYGINSVWIPLEIPRTSARFRGTQNLTSELLWTRYDPIKSIASLAMRLLSSGETNSVLSNSWKRHSFPPEDLRLYCSCGVKIWCPRKGSPRSALFTVVKVLFGNCLLNNCTANRRSFLRTVRKMSFERLLPRSRTVAHFGHRHGFAH